MPYDSSDEVWEEEEASGDDDIKNYNTIVLEQIFRLAASVFKLEQYDLKDFTCEIYRNEWTGEIDLWILLYVSGLVHQSNIACAHDRLVT